jgi:hypothetical protein
VGEHEGAYRRRRPEGPVLYEAVRDNHATLLADVFACGRFGGRLRVLAYLTAPVRSHHPGALGTAHAAWETGPGTGATPETLIRPAHSL